LGSRLARHAARAGANLLGPEIHRQTRRELAYREPGALIDEARLWSNLLSSMPLAFNLFAPVKLEPVLARRLVNALCPDFMSQVIQVVFEHSPGRGDNLFTDDGTAFDVCIIGRDKEGGRVFLAIEIKYAEGMSEAEPRHRSRYDTLAASCGLFTDADDPWLRRNPYQQLWRQHMLAQSMVDCGLYDAGRYLLIAPRQNNDVQRAARRYAKRVIEDPSKVEFSSVTLEDVVEALRGAGAQGHARALHERYCDFTPVHDLVEAECARIAHGGDIEPAAATETNGEAVAQSPRRRRRTNAAVNSAGR
ncbi:MAG: hypothetical protein AB7T08_16200, partial [Hyphomonadaceae bacterium]